MPTLPRFATISGELIDSALIFLNDRGVAGAMKVSGFSFHGTYETSRAISSLFSFFGWALVVVGVLIAVGGMSAGPPFSALIAGVGLGLAAMGLLQVAAGQMLRATVDTADYSRQSLILAIASAEGRPQVDLGRIADGPTPGVSGKVLEGLPRATKTDEPGQEKSEISMGLSNAAIAVLRRAADKGYDVRFSPDKTSVVLTSGSFQKSFSSEDEIIRFGQAMR